MKKLIAPGNYFKENLEAIAPPLDPQEKRDLINSTNAIISKAEKAYRTSFGNYPSSSKPSRLRAGQQSPSGLIYGRIQSGKTRAMIACTAMALDKGFKIVVVTTTDNNRLVGQTHGDFQSGLPSVTVYSKDELYRNVNHIGNLLKGGRNVVLVCSKGSFVLRQTIDFLRQIDANKYPAIIFDDEGDQATLDTNMLKRTTTRRNIRPSTIHSLIHDVRIDSIRTRLPLNVFISVTGTPQGLVLQNTRPAFIEILKPGKDYVGGETFFADPNPGQTRYINTIDPNEVIRLLRTRQTVTPQGLKDAICFFLLSAAAASSKLGWPQGGFKFLCHPSVRNADHERVEALINGFLDEIANAIDAPKKGSSSPVMATLRNQYANLRRTVSPGTLPGLLNIIKVRLHNRRILIINHGTTNQTLNYSPYLNLLVGGNSIGRGLVIKDLLVTYYVREALTTQMDTLYQHARMFGYRRKTLPYTRVFLPPQLYNRFHQTYTSDTELRSFIENQRDPLAILVRTAAGVGLRPTRKNILDANQTKVLSPGTQLYPDYPVFINPDATVILQKVQRILSNIDSTVDYWSNCQGKNVTTDQAIQLINAIRTSAQNKWNDRQIPDVLRSLAIQCGDGVVIRTRRAPRRSAGDNGLLAQGVLSGEEVRRSAAGNRPTLWLVTVDGKNGSGWGNVDFIYPTIVIPANCAPFVFNRT